MAIEMRPSLDYEFLTSDGKVIRLITPAVQKLEQSHAYLRNAWYKIGSQDYRNAYRPSWDLIQNLWKESIIIEKIRAGLQHHPQENIDLDSEEGHLALLGWMKHQQNFFNGMQRRLVQRYFGSYKESLHLQANIEKIKLDNVIRFCNGSVELISRLLEHDQSDQ